MDFRILGALEVFSNGEALALGGRKQRELLAVLLLHANEVLSHDRLIDALWEDDPPAGARKALQMHVSGLRKLLGRDRLQTRAPGYLLRLSPGELDLTRFVELREQGKLQEALALWRGPALADFHYQRFAQAQIVRLEELHLATLEARIDRDLAAGRQAELVGELEALVQANPLRERLRAQLMLSLYRCGRQADALTAYQQARQALVEGLGVEPARPLRELHQQILRQDEDLDSPQPLRKPAPRLQAGLSEPPFALDRFVGRARELAEVDELLRGDVRLLTLTGPGGTGKTRLALEVARSSAAAFDEGARFVSLAPLADPELVLPTITRALGIRALEGESEPEAMRRVLEDASLLLVLDNYEHLLDAAPVASRLAAAIPELTILATSRAPLHVTGEHLWPVSPLDLPEPDARRDPEELAEVAAVALFVDRARAVQPTFELHGDNAAAVAEICVRLDGLPLAIELAAARVAVLPPGAMVGQLDRMLPLLGGGPRDAPERQRTLRATIDWSYNLLDRAAQTDFARLSVFAGSFDAESAEAVSGVGLDALQSLVEKSLVRRWGGRYGMLDTIHELAMVRFGELPDHDEVRRRHAEHFIALAEAARPELRGEAHGTWLDRFETERENFRAALSWSADSGRLDLTCRLAAGFAPFWVERGPQAEARTWMDLTLAARSTLAPEDRAPYLVVASMFAARFDEHDRAWALCEEALALSRAEGDLEGEGYTLMQMAERAYERGRVDDAYGLLDQSADVYRRAGTGWGLPSVVMNLGSLAFERGEYERAEQLYTESLVSYRALNSPINILVVLINLADLTVDRGLPRDADGLLREALDIAVAIKNHYLLAFVLNIFSRVAVVEGSWERAAVLLGARDHLLEETGARWFDRRDEQRALAERETVEAALGRAAFTTAWAEGGAMELDALLRFVRNGG